MNNLKNFIETKKNLLAKYQKLVWFEDVLLNGFDTPGIDSDTPLHIAAFLGDLEDVKTMLYEPININLPGDIGDTPLHYAVLKEHYNVVEFLLKKGANPLVKNDYGDIPLDFAKSNDIKMITLLQSASV